MKTTQRSATLTQHISLIEARTTPWCTCQGKLAQDAEQDGSLLGSEEDSCHKLQPSLCVALSPDTCCQPVCARAHTLRVTLYAEPRLAPASPYDSRESGSRDPFTHCCESHSYSPAPTYIFFLNRIEASHSPCFSLSRPRI